MHKFVSAENQKFWVPITVELPDGKGGFEQHTFNAEFRLYQGTDPDVSDPEFLKQVLVGLDDLIDEDGVPMLAGPENNSRLAANPFYLRPLIAGYLNTISGLEHPEKN